MGSLVAAVDKQGNGAPEAAIKMLGMLVRSSARSYGIASSTNIRIREKPEMLNDKRIESRVAIGHLFSEVLNRDEPQPVLLKDAVMVFEGRLWPSSTHKPDVEVAAEKLQPEHENSAEALIREAGGDFIFAIAEPERVIAGRDSIGSRPLYYGENSNFAALASERKALWKIGLQATDSFPPGSIAIANKKGFEFKLVKTLVLEKPRQTSMHAAARTLQRLLEQSVKYRVAGLKEVAVAFSGGLDSSIVAFLAKQSSVDVHLIHVSLENQLETVYAIKVAEELRLPIHVCLFKEEDLEQVIPKVLWIIEDSKPLNLSIGVPIFWAAEKAASMKLKVMLAGQAADELFAGYRKYVENYLSFGEEKARKRIFHDVTSIHENNLERDCKLCSLHGVELRLPFADCGIAEFATRLPINIKMKPQPDGLRKIVLRKTAKNMGLPETVVEKPKKAMQYTTGVDKTLKRLAKEKETSTKEYLRRILEDRFKRMM